MGNQALKCVKDNKQLAGDIVRVLIPAPTHFKTLTGATVYDIIYTNTKSKSIILFDNEYDTINSEDVKRYLLTNINRDYLNEVWDCENYCFACYTRIHEWASKSVNRKGGLLYGVISGNLRSNAGVDRFHAMNFFIDSENKFWLVEPQTNEISKITDIMEIQQVIL